MGLTSKPNRARLRWLSKVRCFTRVGLGRKVRTQSSAHGNAPSGTNVIEPTPATPKMARARARRVPSGNACRGRSGLQRSCRQRLNWTERRMDIGFTGSLPRERGG